MDRWIRTAALAILLAFLLFTVGTGASGEIEPAASENVTVTISSATTFAEQEGTASDMPAVTISLDPILANDAGPSTIDNCTIAEPRVVRVVHVGDSPSTEDDINVFTYTVLGTETNRSDLTETPSITVVIKNNTIAQGSIAQRFATVEVSMIQNFPDSECRTFVSSAGALEGYATFRNDTNTAKKDALCSWIPIPFLSGSRYYDLDVPSSGKSLWVDMRWEGDGDHTLTVYHPAGLLGTFRDDSDGREDGRIFLRISQEGGIETGAWHFKTTMPLVASSENVTFQMYLE